MREFKKNKAYYHLPGIFEFHEFYAIFLQIYKDHREYFYDWCEIGSIYGSPADCIWSGGRIEYARTRTEDILRLIQYFGISARLTFSNSLLKEEHLSDKKCNKICSMFEKSECANGIIVHSDLLLKYLMDRYPGFYYVSSTTKVITDFEQLRKELDRDEFSYVVPDFRLNKAMNQLETLREEQKNKVEFLCNECCYSGCKDRKACYENVSLKNLGESCEDFRCRAPGGREGYRFSEAMKKPEFISIDDIQNVYLPMGFSNFKIEGRGLGSAILLEFILYYMVKPEWHLRMRELIYLDAMLDLF